MQISKGRNKPLVVVSGLPGSGKSTLAKRLAPLLGLPIIDKDDILDRLFETKGIGDKAWRRTLSRESDDILQVEASATQGAILVSFWRLPGMALDSGTPTKWLSELSSRILNIHCICAPEVAAERCLLRKRHPGHLDSAASQEQIAASIQAISRLGSPQVGHRIDVETSQGPPPLEALTREILEVLCGLHSNPT